MDAKLQIGRIVEEHKASYVIRTGSAEYTATVRGLFHNNDGTAKIFPKVGDYVEYTDLGGGQAVIERIMPRTTEIIRKAANADKPQVIVTNVDVLFIVMGLDNDFNVRRLERYLLLAEQSKIKPVIILNKADVVDDLTFYLSQVEAIAPGIPLHVISALNKEGMDVLLTYTKDGATAALLGSSGAGKSTITNWFLKSDTQETKAVRGDDNRGMHTTISRHLFDLPGGGYLIDTPGIRELGMFTVVEDTSELFERIESLMLECRFTDCDHDKSKGCAIQNAIKEGDLDIEQFFSYLKLKKEQEHIKSKMSNDAHLKNKLKVKKIQKEYKKTQNEKYD